MKYPLMYWEKIAPKTCLNTIYIGTSEQQRLHKLHVYIYNTFQMSYYLFNGSTCYVLCVDSFVPSYYLRIVNIHANLVFDMKQTCLS